jgi:predicted GIY-YIG superfamily endonuclease
MKDYNGIINISEPDDDYCIYKMYSSNKEDNSIYIGVTKDYKQRVYKHSISRKRKEYSNKPLYIWLNKVIDDEERNIIFEVIEKELSEIDAFNKEGEYIQKFKDLGYSVLNLSEGGKGNKGNIPWNKGKKGHLSEEQINLLSLSHLGQISPRKGVIVSEETRQKIILGNKKRKERNWINPRKKTVYKYSNDNVLLATYVSLEEAGLKENVSSTSVGEWCRKEKQPRNGFVYSYTKLT